MSKREVEQQPIYLWAAIGDESAIPGRVRVDVCERCGALVAADRADTHERWHEAVETT